MIQQPILSAMSEFQRETSTLHTQQQSTEHKASVHMGAGGGGGGNILILLFVFEVTNIGHIKINSEYMFLSPYFSLKCTQSSN